MDRALWITWYDLPDSEIDEYLAWLHLAYIPRLLKRPGFLWAAHYASEEKPVHTDKEKLRRHPPADAIPPGHRFILLIGGEEPHVFARPTPRQLHAELPDADRNMLALRTGEAVNIMVEEARVSGPGDTGREAGMALSPCIQLGSFNHDDDDELLAWYAQWRMPSMTRMPGCVAVRKLVSVSGWAKHAILQEFVSLAARNEHFVDHERKRHPQQAVWSNRVTGMVTHAPGSPNVAQRIWSEVKQ